MKKVIACLVSFAILLSSCSVKRPAESSELHNSESESHVVSSESTDAITVSTSSEVTESTTASTSISEQSESVTTDEKGIPHFYGTEDPALLQYSVDEIYASLDNSLDESLYEIDSICSVYLSQEYIDELTGNSQENIFFGYKISELDSVFEGTSYMFVPGDTETTVREAGISYDNTWDRIFKNVAIGGGVILLCVTISFASGGLAMIPGISLGASKISMIFAAGAKTGFDMAISFAEISFISEAIISAIEKQDLEQVLKDALVAGSEGFKIGAIVGAITGAASEAFRIFQSSKVPSHSESEKEAFRRAQKEYGEAYEQKAYLDGKEVRFNEKYGSRPDVVIPNEDGSVIAWEVKNYNLENNYNQLIYSLRDEIGRRVVDLPPGSTQEIYLDVRGRGYSKSFINEVIGKIKAALSDIYYDIPVYTIS